MDDPDDNVISAPGTAGHPAAPVGFNRDHRLLSEAFWLDTEHELDAHVGFRGYVDLPAGTYRIQAQAVSTFRVWVDDELVMHGPVRYVPAVPEVAEIELVLRAGIHRIELEAHHEGVTTRTNSPLPPFAWATLVSEDDEVHRLAWRARSLEANYPPTGRRTSPLLGWIEQQDLRVTPWRALADESPGWHDARPARDAQAALGVALAMPARSPLCAPAAMRRIGEGMYVDTYAGYVLDDPAVQFLLADPDPEPGRSPDGYWFRFDLERVRIGSIELTVFSEREAVVTVGYAERLTPDGRPSPVVALSTGPTAFVQRFLVPAGESVISPLQTLGGRYIEVRIETDGTAGLPSAAFRDRDLLGEPAGLFISGDDLLDRIWQVGLTTQRSAAEDAIVDSIRERGEWLGDVVSASLAIMHSGWGDTGLARRAVLHAAFAARPDGLVAGCGPGELIYLGTYAAQWTAACLSIAELEQSDELLHQLVDVARANVEAVSRRIADDGTNTLPWGFVDWGYEIGAAGVDVAVLAHALLGVQAWRRWLRLIDRSVEADEWLREETRLSDLIRAYLPSSSSPYQATTLAARAGLVSAEDASTVILDSLQRGFPFDRDAPRLKNPTTWVKDAVTPYFTNYSVATLLDAGRGSDAREIWRTAWGWMLDEGATTWWEVFDDRWSRCHAWSGAPTWQMTQYVLGLKPSPNLDGWTVRVNTLGMDSAKGIVPLGGTMVRVSWEVQDDVVVWTGESDAPVRYVGIPEPTTRVDLRLTRLRGDLYGL